MRERQGEGCVREIVFYGLGARGDVEITEKFVGLSDIELKSIATALLVSHYKVEAWEGAVRVLTLSRSSAAGPSSRA